MKKLIIYLPIIVLMLVTAGACESEIKFKGSEVEPMIVIYSLLNPDSLVTVTIAESHAVFESRYEPRQITNASVRLYRDGELIETLTYVPVTTLPDYYPADRFSRYVSLSHKPVHGSTYRIEVDVDGLESAWGETRLPEPVPVISVDTGSVIIEEYSGEVKIKVKFRDPADTDNYYRLTAKALTGTYLGNLNEPYDPSFPVTVYNSDIGYGALSEPLIAPQQEDDLFGMYLQNDFYLFMDELIDGKEYSLTLAYSYPGPLAIDHYEFIHAYFSLHTITKDVYLYLLSYSAQRQTIDNFLAEPVPVYTNITGGLGVVGAVSVSTDTLKTGEYPVEGVYYDYQAYYNIK
ncbi:MAG: DUF4249 domain-containing protein [Bacteroidales bacterium]|nr:DUF4249 domain-containing protein [Bacteroidales bacterium]MDT8374323.1 DUF4249 domain-containing protein [Bacteroidales bacterium]